VLWATFLLILVLIIPLYLLLKLKKAIYLLTGASYLHFDKAGVINGIISVLLLLVFFGKFIFLFKGANETDPELS
jgi:hypothetical protein